MVHGKPALFVTVPLEQWEIGDPQKREGVSVQQVLLLGHGQPELAQQF